MAKLTEKDNFMMTVRGETPAWVSRYGMGPNPFSKHPPAVTGIGPSIFHKHMSPQGGTDIWGVEFVSTRETGYMSLPKPGEFLLDDIRNWRDVVKAPDLSGVDWETMAKNDIKNMNVNREETACVYMTHVGYFQTLMNFMGFTNGLIAMFEEPDEVIALFEYLSDFYCDIAKKAVHYYKPDVFNVTDDTATATNPFISPEMYRSLVKPYHARLAQIGIDAGLPIEMHNCGRCEDFIEDWRDFGVCLWNPAQVVNDLQGIKAKYGNSLVLCGCWDSQGPAGWAGAPEELVRQAVRDTIDAYAGGGGFIFWGSVYGDPDDPTVDDKRRWMTEEYENYRETPYK